MANNFLPDSNCVAWYTMEDSPWVHASDDCLDHMDNGNDLLVFNATQDGTYYKEGIYSAYNDSSTLHQLYNLDASLSLDFPGKYGYANRTLSVVGWFRPTSLANDYYYLVSKWYSGDDKRNWCLRLKLEDAVYTVTFAIGYNGGVDNEVFELSSPAFAINRWYHIAATYNGDTKAWHMRVWDENAATVYDQTGTGTQTMNIENAYFAVGGRHDSTRCFVGYYDEVVIFKDILTSTEIDQIRNGTYGGEIPDLTPPFKAINPDPADEEIDVTVSHVLSWEDGGGATSYDVWFGTDDDSMVKVSSGQVGLTYDPTLAYYTTYYWRIDSINDDGTTTGTVWSFTTLDEDDDESGGVSFSIWPLTDVYPIREDYRQGILIDPTVRTENIDGKPLYRSGDQNLFRTWQMTYRHLTATQKETLEAFQETIEVGVTPFYYTDVRPESAPGAGGGSAGTYTVQLAAPIVFDLDDEGETYQCRVSLNEYCG